MLKVNRAFIVVCFSGILQAVRLPELASDGDNPGDESVKRRASRCVELHGKRADTEYVIRAPNVGRLSGGEAPDACGGSGAPFAATNESVGGRDLQAA